MLCELYCEFDVPNDYYGDFIAAAGEAQAEEADAAAYATDEKTASEKRAANTKPGDAKPEGSAEDDVADTRAENGHGWNKAVAIRKAAHEEDKDAAEAKTKGEEVDVVVEQPDETVEVAVEGVTSTAGKQG